MEVKYSRILVTLDGSVFAEQALAHAEQLALGLDARLILMSCIEPFVISLPAEPVMGAGYDVMTNIDALEAQRKEYLEQLRVSLVQKGVACEIALRQGLPADEILDMSDTDNIDLIIMTTHGRTGIFKVVYGSITQDVLNRSKLPVLLVRSKKNE